jgi:hypothetical protein
MLAFDIETMGLDSSLHAVTCVCAYDPEKRVDVTIFPGKGEDMDVFFTLMDDAETICAFNGGRFDLPFLQVSFGVDSERVGRWRAKLIDILEHTRLCFDKWFSLNRLLEVNGIPCKISNGMEAVHMAAEERWDELGEYCRQDTIKTWDVTHMALQRSVMLPIRGIPGSLVMKGRTFEVLG